MLHASATALKKVEAFSPLKTGLFIIVEMPLALL